MIFETFYEKKHKPHNQIRYKRYIDEETSKLLHKFNVFNLEFSNSYEYEEQKPKIIKTGDIHNTELADKIKTNVYNHKIWIIKLSISILFGFMTFVVFFSILLSSFLFVSHKELLEFPVDIDDDHEDNSFEEIIHH